MGNPIKADKAETRAHALLGASSAKRWIHCPPSARLTEHLPDKSSEFAAEGHAAHELCEHKLKAALGMPTTDPTENLNYYNEEMERNANTYVAFVLNIIAEARKSSGIEPQVLIEQHVDYSRWAEEGFGTADVIVVADCCLHVVDLKYGKGVPVDCEQNPQMMLYALGALEIFDYIFDIDEISMTIYQPRIGNISTSTIDKLSLNMWADTVMRPAAKLAWDGEGEYAAGDWCRFCKAGGNCRERAEVNLELAKIEFKDPPLLLDDEVTQVLGQLDGLTEWAKSVKEYALSAAVAGHKFDGWKLVRAVTKRVIKDEDAAAKKLRENGFGDIYKSSLKGLGDLAKVVGGDKNLNKILAGIIVKPEGKPSLVDLGDKREELVISSAAEDFADVAIEIEDED